MPSSSNLGRVPPGTYLSSQKSHRPYGRLRTSRSSSNTRCEVLVPHLKIQAASVNKTFGARGRNAWRPNVWDVVMHERTSFKYMSALPAWKEVPLDVWEHAKSLRPTPGVVRHAPGSPKSGV